MGLDFGGRLGQIILVVINIIFMLMGLGLLIPGIVLQTNIDFVTAEIKPVLDQIAVTGVPLGDIVTNLGIGFIIVGLFVFLVAAVGLLGACCKSKCLLTVYSIVVLLVLLSEIVVVILWFTMQSELNSAVKDKLVTLLREGYREDSLNGTNQISNGWNYIFLTLQCCGVNAVANGTAGDFQNTPNWSGKSSGQKLPISCCKGVTAASYNAPSTCTVNAQSGTYHAQGCYDTLISKFDTSQYSNVFLGIGITIFIIELLAIICSILMCRGNYGEGNLA
ncbi:leukocyte surface antigen CD53 isoform X1 [Ostrea edulis]|nr:leukocyte surface antigen CD53 isoform X1 [Ostrea edulis]XP_048773379.2 leukocyte surface antigen CD53 isoform X1 [Ostrea edulis]